ncbi:DUF4192 domain-containing protein [Actinocorallia populi]|uniref:DUF4192 domain-containing protein n=1 Tax=Actinocorallia populi TaxID=2079200 RepID=UPI000D0866F0|nr:DUF4192 domain-containing protein [Actinocorallia populi]
MNDSRLGGPRRGSSPLVIRDAADLVSAVPYMLGFHPSDSLVAIGCGGPRGSCALRYDLSLPPPAALHLAEVLAFHDFKTAMLVGYGPREQVAPSVELAVRALRGAGIPVHETVRVHEGRFWPDSFDEGEGSPLTATPLAAQAVLDGLVALPGRECLAATIAPLPDPVRALALRETAGIGGEVAVAEGLALVRTLAAELERGDPPPSVPRIARLTVALGAIRVRDEAWVRIDPGAIPEHLEFWRHVLRRTAPPLLAAPASLFAYCALLSGEGGLANLALDLALEADPAYSMALLLRQAIVSGMHPSSITIGLTPRELADSYRDPPELRAGLSEEHPPPAAARRRPGSTRTGQAEETGGREANTDFA